MVALIQQEGGKPIPRHNPNTKTGPEDLQNTRASSVVFNAVPSLSKELFDAVLLRFWRTVENAATRLAAALLEPTLRAPTLKTSLKDAAATLGGTRQDNFCRLLKTLSPIYAGGELRDL